MKTRREWLGPMTPREERVLSAWETLLGVPADEPVRMVSTEEMAIMCVVLFLRWAASP